MASEDKNNYSARWTVGIAGTLIALLMSVFMVGWNARGQTAAITAVEVKTTYLESNFNLHCKQQREDTKSIDDTLRGLKENGANQTMLLSHINDKLAITNNIDSIRAN